MSDDKFFISFIYNILVLGIPLVFAMFLIFSYWTKKIEFCKEYFPKAQDQCVLVL